MTGGTKMLNWYFYGKNGKHDESKYNALTEDQKKFFHEALGLFMMCCEIGHISTVTLPILLERINMQDLYSRKITEEELKPFIGVVANVETKGSKEFFALKFRTKTTAQLNKDWTEFRKELEKKSSPKKPGDDLDHVSTKHWKACQGSYLVKGVCGNCK
jgi:hypothetical protein